MVQVGMSDQDELEIFGPAAGGGESAGEAAPLGRETGVEKHETRP